MGKAPKKKTAEVCVSNGLHMWRTRLNDQLTSWVLPLGVLLLLTSMMWAGEKRLFQQLFYVFLALPAFILALNDRSVIAALLRNPVFIAFLSFSAYVSISIVWSGTDESALSLLKRPLYVLCLFFGCAGVAIHRPDRLKVTLQLSAAIAVIAAGVQISIFLVSGNGDRLPGYGALYNPLLTSHVFGFFLVLWIAYWIQRKQFFVPSAFIAVAMLGGLILATGSRTPLLALSATIIWMALMAGGRRGALVCALLILAAAATIVLWPEIVTERGLSYRPQIWADTVRQALESPILGHGYDHPIGIYISALDQTFREPHNVTLSVFYQGGALGLLLWAALFLTALSVSWRKRTEPLVFVLSATMVYGLSASMTEGGSFLSRPKEHWYLFWIPITLLTAATLRTHENGD